MHRRGIRICIGGDYGFAWTPQGTNAKDIQTFVEMLGFSPMEAILAATKFGGQIMGMGDELGQIKDGLSRRPAARRRRSDRQRPRAAGQDRILAIMKDGQFHKAPKMNEQQRRRLTA